MTSKNPSGRISALPSWLPDWTGVIKDSPANYIWSADSKRQPNAKIKLRTDCRSIDVGDSLFDVVDILGMQKGDEKFG